MFAAGPGSGLSTSKQEDSIAESNHENISLGEVMFRALVYIILGCASASLHAHADWNYPVSAQLAMYDAVEHRCGSVDRATLRQKYAEMVRRLSPEERAEMKNARQSAQYREVLAGTAQELAQMIAKAGEDGETKLCKDMMQRM